MPTDIPPPSAEEPTSPPADKPPVTTENPKSRLIDFFNLGDDSDDEKADATPSLKTDDEGNEIIPVFESGVVIQGASPKQSPEDAHFTSALTHLFAWDEEEGQDELFASLPSEASITSPESLTYIQFANSPQIISPSVLEFLSNRRAALSLHNPQGALLAEPKVRYASTGWIIIDYGNRLLTGPGERAFDRDFLTAPARTTTHELVHLAQERKWPEIAIDSLDKPEAQPLAEKMRLFAWEEGNHLGLHCTGFTPTNAETTHLEHIRKVLGGPTPSDSQTPS